MGKGRKKSTQKMKMRKRQAKVKDRLAKRKEAGKRARA
jgi:hypothetical protein